MEVVVEGMRAKKNQTRFLGFSGAGSKKKQGLIFGVSITTKFSELQFVVLISS